MVTLWQILFYMFLAILAIFIFRLLVHLLIKLMSNKRIFPLKLRVDKDFDFIEGWQTEDENNSGDNDDEKKPRTL